MRTVIAAAVVLAQATSSPDPSGGAGLAGRVLDAVSGAPVAGARVEALEVASRSTRFTRAGADGRYAFGHLASGTDWAKWAPELRAFLDSL